MTSVGEVVIARAHITVLPRLLDAETRRVAGGWRVVKLSLQFVTRVTSLVEVKVQLIGVEFVHVINHFKRKAGAGFGFKRTATFLYPANVGTISTWNTNGTRFTCISYIIKIRWIASYNFDMTKSFQTISRNLMAARVNFWSCKSYQLTIWERKSLKQPRKWKVRLGRDWVSRFRRFDHRECALSASCSSRVHAFCDSRLPPWFSRENKNAVWHSREIICHILSGWLIGQFRYLKILTWFQAG